MKKSLALAVRRIGLVSQISQFRAIQLQAQWFQYKYVIHIYQVESPGLEVVQAKS
jgi:hypothetical protein